MQSRVNRVRACSEVRSTECCGLWLRVRLCVCGPNLRFEVGFHLSGLAHGRLRCGHCCRIALRHCHHSPRLGIAGSSGGRGRGCTGTRNGRMRRRCTHKREQSEAEREMRCRDAR